MKRLRDIDKRRDIFLYFCYYFLFLYLVFSYNKLSQIRYSLVVILELNSVSEVQYKDVIMVDDGKYQ